MGVNEDKKESDIRNFFTCDGMHKIQNQIRVSKSTLKCWHQNGKCTALHKYLKTCRDCSRHQKVGSN